MLHKIPDSPLRNVLLKLVDLQRTLITSLCALPEASTVDLVWLRTSVWPSVDAEWVERFWNLDKGERQAWLATIAAASAEAKEELLKIVAEQHDYTKLYDPSPTHSVTKTDMAFWSHNDVRKATKKLMVAFYSPWLDANRGYPASMLSSTTDLTRVEYLKNSSPIVCPYCDTKLQKIELDHFLPESSFPFLSVHPDNLVPCCHDSNEASKHKGHMVPLDWEEPEQAAKYFHPRLRPARHASGDRIGLRFRDELDHLRLCVEGVDAADHERAKTLDQMFKLTEFWGKALESQIQDLQEEVAEHYKETGRTADEAGVRAYLAGQAATCQRYIGKRPLSIFHAALYGFVASDGKLLKNTVERVMQGG